MTDLVNEVAAPVAANETAAPATEAPTIAQTMGDVFDKLNPPRRGNGQFQAKAPVEQPAAEGQPAAETVETVSTDQPAKAEPEPAQPAIDAPHSWSAEMKAKWTALPPEAQSYIAQRERETHQAITRAGEQIKQFEPIRGVIEQFAGTFQRTGLPPAEGIARMLAVETYLESNPRAAIADIARAYGVDLSGAQPTPESEHVSRLEQKIAQLEGKLTSRERSELQAREADLARSIDTASKGLPHFEEVRSIVAGLLSSGAVPDGDVPAMIKAAYDMAIHASPTIRERIQADQRKADEAKAKQDAERKAAEARKAASLNVKSNTGSAPSKPKTMRQDMEAVADKHGLM